MSSNSLALPSSANRDHGNWCLTSHDDDNGRNQHHGVPLSLRYGPQDEGDGLYGQWRLFEERVRSGPYGLSSFPSQPFSPVRILVLGPATQERVNPRLRQFISNSPQRIRNDWRLALPHQEPEDPGLTDDEFKKAMKKLRKEVYSPTYPRKKSWTQGLFSTKSSLKLPEKRAEEKNEGKQCIICLEDFAPNEKVMVTPCNHMFHNDCLVPWVKTHGQCPVCRFALCERKERPIPLSAYNNNNNHTDNNNGIMSDDDLAVDLVSLIRAMEEALNWVTLSR